MVKHLLDQLIKNKLNSMHFPYSKTGWQNMEKMLDANKGGASINNGMALGTKIFLASGVVVLGTTIALVCLNKENKINQETTDMCKSKQVEILVDSPKVINDESKTVTIQQIQNTTTKKKAKIKKEIPVMSNSQIIDEVGVLSSESIKSSVVESELFVESPQFIELPSTTQDVVVEDKAPLTISVEGENNNVKPMPVPAKDVFKKKRKGIFKFFSRKR